jgi:hypothetical protein
VFLWSRERRLLVQYDIFFNDQAIYSLATPRNTIILSFSDISKISKVRQHRSEFTSSAVITKPICRQLLKVNNSDCLGHGGGFGGVGCPTGGGLPDKAMYIRADIRVLIWLVGDLPIIKFNKTKRWVVVVREVGVIISGVVKLEVATTIEIGEDRVNIPQSPHLHSNVVGWGVLATPASTVLVGCCVGRIPHILGYRTSELFSSTVPTVPLSDIVVVGKGGGDGCGLRGSEMIKIAVK